MARELGPAAGTEFRAIREAFAACFRAEEPSSDDVLAVARRAARFERGWLSRRSRGATDAGSLPAQGSVRRPHRATKPGGRVPAEPRSP